MLQAKEEGKKRQKCLRFPCFPAQVFDPNASFNITHGAFSRGLILEVG